MTLDILRRIVLVANRLPVTAKLVGNAVELVPSPGGLATALRRVHARAGSRWIGWAGDLGSEGTVTHSEASARLEAGGLVPVELAASEVRHFYDGFSNGLLWPLFHYMTSRLERDVSEAWKAYRRVNERFAAAAARVVRPGDLVWVHDYHLLLVPALLRRLVPDAAIGFFLHTPFPAAEVFRALPGREELLAGLLAANLVGFHTADYAHHFRYAAVQLSGAEDHGDELVFEDRRVHVGAYPLGVDFAALAAQASSPQVAQLAAEWGARVRGQPIVLGVDRMDYTKGIPRRLLAIERFLDRSPAWHDRVQFVQVAVPSRERGDEYVAFRRDVHELVGRINGRFGMPGWTPIHLLHRSVDATTLAALYRAASVMLVTPLRDGMNLVAKEYCACRPDEDGVLVLSEFAGAAAELREAVLVNPYDLDATAEAIRRALEMPKAEQYARMHALRATISGTNVDDWAAHVLGDLQHSVPAQRTPQPLAEETPPLGDALQAFRSAARRLLFLDYDGTLVPFAPMPDLAFPDEDLRALLAQLAADEATEVHVLSGRSRVSLDGWLGNLPLTLHAEHGFWSRERGGAWSSVSPAPIEELRAVEAAMSAVARRTLGSFVERKGASIAFHYRMAEPVLAARRLMDLRRDLRSVLAGNLEILEGVRVLEVKVRGIDKSAAARSVVARSEEKGGACAVLAIGDDRTDEDVFATLPSNALTVRVGQGATRARYRIDGPQAVRELLRSLT